MRCILANILGQLLATDYADKRGSKKERLEIRANPWLVLNSGQPRRHDSNIACGVWVRQLLRSFAHSFQAGPITQERADRFHQVFVAELRFFEHDGCAGSLEGFRITLLVIVGRSGKWHKNRLLARRSHLGDRAGAGTAQEQDRPREETGHIVDEAIDLDPPTQTRISRLGVIIVTFSGLMDDVNLGDTRPQHSRRFDHYVVDGMRALTAPK